jgi:hypothetical protein
MPIKANVESKPSEPRCRASCLKGLDDLFGGEHGIRLGRVIIRRNKADRGPALDKNSGMRVRAYGRPPMPRTALVSNNRKLRFAGHVVSDMNPALTILPCQHLRWIYLPDACIRTGRP